jgi:nucleotide-binding universal stress UspA family protein
MPRMARRGFGAMFALKRILVPTNLGEPSKAAVKYGVAFARQFRAKLYLLHVLDAKEFEAAIETERVLETFEPDAPMSGTDEPDSADVARNAARESLGRVLTTAEERDTEAEYLLRPARAGNAGDAIVACAEELGVELVVMGKHRIGFVEHLVAGSVAEKVVRRAPCPVLVVHYPEHDFVQDDA